MKQRNLLVCGLIVVLALVFTGCDEQHMCNHSNMQQTVVTEATCSIPGLHHWECPDCGYGYDNDIGTDSTKHLAATDGSVQEITAATCMAVGTRYGRCQYCGEDQYFYTPIDPTAHVWRTETTQLAASEMTNGYKDAILCDENTAHTPQSYTGVEWATGTNGLQFEKIDGKNEYRITAYSSFYLNQGNLYDMYIPAYHREDEGSTYYPVTELGTLEDSEIEGIFHNYWSISNLTFAPETQLKIIGSYAFANIKAGFGNIIIPAGVTSIGDGAFKNVEELESINIPASVTSIGNSVFGLCKELVNITVDAANTAYISENGVLYNKAKTTLLRGKSGSNTNIPAGVTTIGSGAFSGCKFDNITIPASVITIGDEAFENVTSSGKYPDITIAIPNSVTTIGKRAFFDCKEKITLGNGIKTIGNHAFSFSSISLTAIPNSVQTIGDEAFANCYNIENITIPASVTSLGKNAFDSCNYLKSITVNASNPNYASEAGILYNKAKTTLIRAPSNLSGAISILNSVTTIEENAFPRMYDITSITIPSTVTYIHNSAFGWWGYSNNTITVIFKGRSEIPAEWEWDLPSNITIQFN